MVAAWTPESYAARCAPPAACLLHSRRPPDNSVSSSRWRVSRSGDRDDKTLHFQGISLVLLGQGLPERHTPTPGLWQDQNQILQCAVRLTSRRFPVESAARPGETLPQAGDWDPIDAGRRQTPGDAEQTRTTKKRLRSNSGVGLCRAA